MTTTRMLIDARHREETRVAVVKGNRIDEFDFESAERKQLKGNIYLAKVTRVEPSLQAAFIDYGGNRHGFLAFSEIHPDYYQIPKEDREALLREEAEHAAEEDALRAGHEGDEDDFSDRDHGDEVGLHEGDDQHDDDGADYHGAEEHGAGGDEGPAEVAATAGSGGHDDTVEALRRKRMNLRHRYKIQDVIRRRQVLLVQVVKEERGNKGAALTTYLSLAGRYCVLMPNTSHGGGISRKISDGADRKRLKSIMAELKLPSTMGCIVRTAGLQRTKTEIKRDFDYLARLWDEIRDKTLASSAPALVYGDSDLIKRAIRDIYNRDIDEVIVEGEDGYRAARSFMKLLMPTHARRVQHYADVVPLFQRHGVEDQLAAMYNPVVQLKSGGYLVINPTEALVSIDINSGRSTREHNIEQTALSTNLEAAREIARQLRLRDMAGLVVIDFIDMESNGNVRKVERAMKDALKDDRARIQIGRISSFGLMEMSRQRLRTGVLEASTRTCPHCEGSGLVRTASSAGLSALRMLEEEAVRGRGSRLLLRSSQEAAFYVLNRKRAELAEIEERYGVMIEVMSDGVLEGARMVVEAGGPPPMAPRPIVARPIIEEDDDDLPIEDEEEIEEEEEEAPDSRPTAEPRQREGGEEGQHPRGRRRRRRNRGGQRHEEAAEGQPAPELAEAGDAEDGAEPAEGEAPDGEGARAEGEGQGESRRRRSRRGRRGGRSRSGAQQHEHAGDNGEPVAEEAFGQDEAGAGSAADDVVAETGSGEVAAAEAAAPAAEEPAEEPARRPRRRPSARRASAPEAGTETVAPAAEPAGEGDPQPAAEPAPAAEPEATPRPRRGRGRKVATAVAEPEAVAEAAPADAAPVEAAPVDTAPAETAPAEPAAPVRARRSRSRKEAPPAEVEAAPAPAADPEATSEEAGEPAAAPAGEATADEADGSPRRGWWQRTFGV